MARSSPSQPARPAARPLTPPAGREPDRADELTELREQLNEARDTLEAIRSGAVDSLVIGPPGEEQVYTLTSADRPYRLIVENMNEGAATLSSEGVIVYGNPRLGVMVGRPTTDLVGLDALELATAPHRVGFAGLLGVEPGSSARGELELAAAGGEHVPVGVSVSGFELDGRERRCLVFTDLTIRRQAEQELAALAAELEERVQARTFELERSNRNLEAFTYSVSHDLRAPLRALSGFSSVLIEEYADQLGETGRSYAERLRQAALRMAELIDDLLMLSRVSRAELTRQEVDLSEIARQALAELQRHDPDRRGVFSVEDGVVASADPRLIRTVLENLLGNAWKFTARRREARIGFGSETTPGGERRFFVRDNGAGFDSRYAEKLFQPFSRLHSAEEFPGTGIGLASVRNIVERHGGATGSEGEVDRGATFWFSLGPEPSGPPRAGMV